MLIGLLFALVAVACGLAVTRAARVQLSLAPVGGLASMAVLAIWSGALEAPPLLRTGLVVVLALVGAATTLRSLRGMWRPTAAWRWSLVVLALAAAIPAVLLGTAFAGVDTPVSTHDGAFHVETIDRLRQGAFVQMWYPTGFHASAAALLVLLPWLDSARGTTEVGLGLAVLAPMGLFALALAIGLRPLEAAAGAVVLGLTYIYPYDNHVWGGWPLSMSIVLLLGLWAVAARWITHPSPTLAALGGGLAGAILLTHGTEAYSAVIGLAVIAALNWRSIAPARLLRHLPLAIACALVCVLPYLAALVAWTSAGGASGVGAATLDSISANPEFGAGGDWLEFVLGVTGASGFLDLPLRLVLLGIGARSRHMRVVVAAWVVFSALLFAVSFLDVPPIRWLFVVTYPWLIHHRPPQIVVLFASLLIASGVSTSMGWVWSLRARLAPRPRVWRRLATVSGVMLAFFAEGSVISIYKTLDEVIVQQGPYSPDDRAAMAWLRHNAQPGELVVNDQAADAGIWTPYKAGLAILLPRSADGPQQELRKPILTNVQDLSSAPAAQAEACALHVGYLYSGVRPLPLDVRLLPDRAALDRAPDLEEVFSSGQTTVFRIHLVCG